MLESVSQHTPLLPLMLVDRAGLPSAVKVVFPVPITVVICVKPLTAVDNDTKLNTNMISLAMWEVRSHLIPESRKSEKMRNLVTLNLIEPFDEVWSLLENVFIEVFVMIISGSHPWDFEHIPLLFWLCSRWQVEIGEHSTWFDFKSSTNNNDVPSWTEKPQTVRVAKTKISEIFKNLILLNLQFDACWIVAFPKKMFDQVYLLEPMSFEQKILLHI